MAAEGYDDVTLDTIAEGRLPGMFAADWQALVDNVHDPNTDPDAVRKLIITISVRPDGGLEHALVDVRSELKLAKTKPARSLVYFARTRKGITSSVSRARQMDWQEQLDKQEDDVPNLNERRETGT